MKLRLFVVWQSLVVKSYRSFFAHLAEHQKAWDLTLIAPHSFVELGQQKLPCAPFGAPFDGQDPRLKVHILLSLRLHHQILLLLGLKKAFQSPKHKPATGLMICMAEPYSLTALLVLLSWKLSGQKGLFVCFSLQNIAKNFSWPLSQIQKILFRHSKAILSLGAEQTKVLRQQGYQAQIIPFPLWFDSSRFLFDEPSPVTNPFAHLLPQNVGKRPKVLSYCGSLFEEKGLPDLCEALALLEAEERTELCVLFAGEGSYKAALLGWCERLNNLGLKVHYLGPLDADKVPQLFKLVDILCLPSRTETHWKEQFGRVIVEAQACGAAVIGSDSGAIPEVIGDQSHIFPERNPAELLRVLRAQLARIPDSESEYQRSRRTRAEQAYLRYSDRSLAAHFSSQLAKLVKSESDGAWGNPSSG